MSYQVNIILIWMILNFVPSLSWWMTALWLEGEQILESNYSRLNSFHLNCILTFYMQKFKYRQKNKLRIRFRTTWLSHILYKHWSHSIPLTFSERSLLPIFSRASLNTLTVALSHCLLFHSLNITVHLSTTRWFSLSMFFITPSGMKRRLLSIFQLVLTSSARSWQRAGGTGVFWKLRGITCLTGWTER